MEINPKYIQRYWYQIVADQIADEYRQKEYTIYREYQVDDIRASTITVKGRCVAQLDTWFDNESDTDFTYYVPIAFILDLQYGKHGWEVIEEHKLEIDTSQLDN